MKIINLLIGLILFTSTLNYVYGAERTISINQSMNVTPNTLSNFPYLINQNTSYTNFNNLQGSCANQTVWSVANVSSNNNSQYYLQYNNCVDYQTYNTTGAVSKTQMKVGNGTGTSFSATGVWDSNYQVVLHLNDNPILNIQDSTSNNRDGITGGFSANNSVAGYFGNATIFKTTPLPKTFVSLGDTLDFGTSNVTIEGWYKGTDTGGWIASKGLGGDYSWSFGTISGIYIFILYQSAGVEHCQATSTAPSGNWDYIVGQWNSGLWCALYVNNVLVANDTTLAGTFDSDTTANFTLGGRDDDSGGAGNLDGSIDEFRFSNTLRSYDWIKQTYNTGKLSGLSTPTIDAIGQGVTFRSSIVKDSILVDGSILNTNITIQNSTTNSTIGVVFAEFNSTNFTMTKFISFSNSSGGGIFNFNGTISGLNIGSYTIRYFANETIGNKTYTDSNENELFQIAEGINISVFDEDTLASITHYKVIMTNGSFTSYITVDKTSSLLFLDDNQTTSLNASINNTVNYTFGVGYTNANFSIIYATNSTTSSINVSVLDTISNSFINIYTISSTQTSKQTAYFSLDNRNNSYGDYPLFNISLTGRDFSVGIYEINMISPYSYNKFGRSTINFANFNVSKGETRLNLDSTVIISNLIISYPTRVYFVTLTSGTTSELDAYLSLNCFSKEFLIKTTGSIVNLEQPLSDALITIKRIFSNNLTTIAQEKSNALGQASICIEQQIPYSVTVEKAGFNTFSTSSNIFFNDGNDISIFLSDTGGVSSTNAPLADNVFSIGTGSYNLFKSMRDIFNATCEVQGSNIKQVIFNITNVTVNNTLHRIVYNASVTTGTNNSINQILHFNVTRKGTYDISCGYEKYLTNIQRSIRHANGSISYPVFNTTEFINVSRRVVYFTPSGLTDAGRFLSNVMQPTTIYFIGLMISMLSTGYMARFFGVASGLVFLMIFGFIITILGDWGYTIYTGGFILTILIWLGLIMMKYG